MVSAAKIRYLFQTSKCFWELLAKGRMKNPARLTLVAEAVNTCPKFMTFLL